MLIRVPKFEKSCLLGLLGQYSTKQKYYNEGKFDLQKHTNFKPAFGFEICFIFAGNCHRYQMGLHKYFSHIVQQNNVELTTE